MVDEQPPEPPPQTPDSDELKQVYDAAVVAAKRQGLSETDAESAAMQAVAEALEKDVLSNPGGFGNDVGAKRAIDEQRRQNRQAIPTAHDEIDVRRQGTDPADHVVLQVIVDELVKIADAELSPSQREAFDGLVKAGGHVADAVKLVAGFTGRDPSTIRTHLDRAVLKLRVHATHLDPSADQ